MLRPCVPRGRQVPEVAATMRNLSKEMMKAGMIEEMVAVRPVSTSTRPWLNSERSPRVAVCVSNGSNTEPHASPPGGFPSAFDRGSPVESSPPSEPGLWLARRADVKLSLPPPLATTRVRS